MDTKIIGGILLIVGTAIGAGMLALPIATAGSGFIGSSLLLLGCWAIMTFSAFLVLEINLWLPPHNNIISMARTTLGKPGEIVAWLSYLLLMYALSCAYISGGSSLFSDLLSYLGFKSPAWINAVLFVGIFGYVVYRGIKPVDYVNRLLMTIKMGTFFILIFFTFPYLDPDKLWEGDPHLLTSTITVMLTSFGFANIIPSLRSYFNSDVKKLRLAILIGSVIPLVCYLVWEFAILGSVPRAGKNGLLQIMQNGGSVTQLTAALSYFLKNSSLTIFSHVFTVICVLTSFLSVGIGLFDFLADGLKIDKKGKGKVVIAALTFLPSLIIILYNPHIFIKALSYAGTLCVILLLLLPGLMTWSGRYHKQFATRSYEVMGGKLSILLLILIAMGILMLAFYHNFIN